MTRDQLIADLRARMDNPEHSDSVLLEWINQAYREIIGEILSISEDFFATSATTDITEDTQEYSLPTDFLKMIGVNAQWTSGGTWYRVRPFNNIGQIPVQNSTDSSQGFTAADPRYYIFGDNIGLMPIPEEDNTGGLKVYYVAQPDDLDASTDAPAFPSLYHHIINYKACMDNMMFEEERGLFDRYKALYNEGLMKMLRALQPRQVDEPRGIEIVDDRDLYGGNFNLVTHYQE